MSTHSEDPGHRAGGRPNNIYDDLRRRNDRRLDVYRLLEGRRLRQIERALQTARDWRPPGGRK